MAYYYLGRPTLCYHEYLPRHLRIIRNSDTPTGNRNHNFYPPLPPQTIAVKEKVSNIHTYNEIIQIHNKISSDHILRLRLTTIVLTNSIMTLLKDTTELSLNQHEQTKIQHIIQPYYQELNEGSIKLENYFTRKLQTGQGKYLFSTNSAIFSNQHKTIIDNITLISKFDYLWNTKIEHLVTEVNTTQLDINIKILQDHLTQNPLPEISELVDKITAPLETSIAILDEIWHILSYNNLFLESWI